MNVPIPCTDEYILTHPANRDALLSALRKARGGSIYDGTFADEFMGLRVRFTEHIAERKIREVWHPPKDRFIEYGPEDETWMRWAGRGTIERIDEGPLFMLMRDPLRVFGLFDFSPIISPRHMIFSNV